jgi:hypothetical protein
MAVGDHSRARVLYRLPEQRRLGSAGMPGLLAAVLLALVLFLGGLVIGRATMSGTPAAEPAAPAATATTLATPAQTAGPGTATAAPQAGAAAIKGVGPRTVVNGIPVGWAHNEKGAVAAAANYAVVLSSSLILDSAKRRVAIDTIAAPEAKARLQRTFEQAVASLTRGLRLPAGTDADDKVLLRAVPVGHRVEQFDDKTARIAIWMTSMGGSLAGVPVQEGWGTTTITLRWAGGDWKQVDTKTTDGPVPIADAATPTAPSELIPMAQEFKEFNYAPGP